jgi:hypothetical protein
MKKSTGSISVTPRSCDVWATASSPILSARWPNASSPWYQWTVTSLPLSVFQSTRVSA